jgi:hypothetical protein
MSQNTYILDKSYHLTGFQEEKSKEESVLHEKILEPKYILSSIKQQQQRRR